MTTFSPSIVLFQRRPIPSPRSMNLAAAITLLLPAFCRLLIIYNLITAPAISVSMRKRERLITSQWIRKRPTTFCILWIGIIEIALSVRLIWERDRGPTCCTGPINLRAALEAPEIDSAELRGLKDRMELPADGMMREATPLDDTVLRL